MTESKVTLPPLVWRESPNQSSRHGTNIDLVVYHETAGHYKSDVAWLCNPKSQASAHLVVREDGGEVTHLVVEEGVDAGVLQPEGDRRGALEYHPKGV